MATKQQAQEFLNNTIRPTLQHLQLGSPAAEELLLGTALVESDLSHRTQMGDGPAKGFFQMEPATNNDIWENYLKFKPQLAELVKQLLSTPNDNTPAELQTNDKYACAMARILYLRASFALPQAGDVQGMANYWKQHYNTPLGAGKVSTYVQKWNDVMG